MISPIDNHYQISKKKGTGRTPSGTFDNLILSMGIELAHIHGSNNTYIITADKRLLDLINRCKKEYSQSIIKKLRLDFAETIVGRKFTKEIFPGHINLNKITKKDLVDIFENISI